MKQMIESFVTVFLVLLSVFIFAQLIGASLQIRSAREFHSMCIGEIENSDLDANVILQCEEAARNNGFELIVDKQEGSESICRVKLKYQVLLALADIRQEGVLYGFAR